MQGGMWNGVRDENVVTWMSVRITVCVALLMVVLVIHFTGIT